MEEQQEIKIKVTQNAGDASKDVNKLAQSLDNVEQSSKQAETQTKSLKAQIKEATIELIQAQQKYGDYSKEALNVAKNLAQLKDRIAEAGETANLFDPGKKFQAVAGAVSAMASGFAVAQGAMGLFGAESEEIEKTILKVQSAMALSQGLSSIADSGKDFQRLKAIVVDAMKAIATAKAVDTVATEANVVATGASATATAVDTTVKGGATIATTALTVATNILNASLAMLTAPIFLVIAAIAGLVAGIGYLTGAFGDFDGSAERAEIANKKLSAEIDNLSKSAEKSNKELERSNNYQYEMAKASGASSAELRKLAEQLMNNEVAEKRLNAVKAQSIFLEARRVASLEDATDEQKATAKKAYELFKEQNGIYNQSLEDRKDLAIKHKIEIQQEETDAENKRLENQKKASEARLEAQKKAQEKALEEQRKANEEKLREEKRLYDEALKIQEEARAYNENSQLTDLEKLTKKYEAEKALLEKQNLDISELEIKYLNEKNELDLAQQKINDDLEKAKKEKKKEEDEKEADEKLEIEKRVADGKKDIQETSNKLLDDGISLLKDFAGKNKAIQKGLVIAESAIGISKIVTSTQAANAADLAASSLMGPAGAGYLAQKKVINATTAGIGIAANLMATSKALSALGGGGAGSGGANVNGGSGGSAPPTVAFNNTAENQIGQSVAKSQAENPPIKVNVLESDISLAQKNVKNLAEINEI